MNKYIVTYSYTIEDIEIVEADSEEEAEAQVRESLIDEYPDAEIESVHVQLLKKRSERTS